MCKDRRIRDSWEFKRLKHISIKYIWRIVRK